MQRPFTRTAQRLKREWRAEMREVGLISYATLEEKLILTNLAYNKKKFF